jgi:hypothetical protein
MEQGRVGWNTEKRNNGIGLTHEKKGFWSYFHYQTKEKKNNRYFTTRGKIRHYKDT